MSANVVSGVIEPSRLRQQASPKVSLLTLALVIVAHVALLAVLARAGRPAAIVPPVAPVTVQVELLSAQATALPTVRTASVLKTPAPVAATPTPAQAKPMRAANLASAVLPTAAQTTVQSSPGGEASASPVVQPDMAAVSAGTPAAAQSPASPAGGSTAPRFDADYLDNPKPAYPALSRRMREEGKVILKVYVEPSGLPSQVEVRTPSPYDRLDQSAIAAVKRWKFAPARQGAEPVGAWVTVPIVFDLRG